MRRLIYRTTAVVLVATVGLGVAALPCAAGEPAGKKAGTPLTRLSPASKTMLAARPANHQTQPANPAPSSPGSFFKSTRGKVTLGLMAAGAGLTLWSIQHDRKPVKSPIR